MQARLYGLDGLRGFAALTVVAMHIVGFAGGHLAVDFFFILSGYLMARTYEGKLRDGRLSALGFLGKRYRRLWPTMAVGATLGLISAVVWSGWSWDLWQVYAFSLLLLPAGAVLPYVLNLPAWSIFYELIANFVHGIVFARAENRALWTMLAIASAAFISSFAIVGFPRMLSTTTLEMQILIVPRVLVSYLMGILFYRYFGDKPPLRVPYLLSLTLFGGFVALVSNFPFPLWPLPFVFLIAPLMMCAGIGERRELRWFGILGDLSFPLYAVHFPILHIVSRLEMGQHSGLIALVASLATAALLARLSTTRGRLRGRPNMALSEGRSVSKRQKMVEGRPAATSAHDRVACPKEDRRLSPLTRR